MYYIYILHSASSDIYYVGQTDNIEIRLHTHNNTDRDTFTSKHRPWCLAALFECGDSRSDAMRLEKFIKKQKSRTLILKMISGEPLLGVLAQVVRVPHVRD